MTLSEAGDYAMTGCSRYTCAYASNSRAVVYDKKKTHIHRSSAAVKVKFTSSQNEKNSCAYQTGLVAAAMAVIGILTPVYTACSTTLGFNSELDSNKESLILN